MRRVFALIVLGAVACVDNPFDSDGNVAIEAAMSLSPGERIESWSQQNPDEPLPANFGFGASVSDAEVLRFLRAHDLAPQAAFMWSSGLTASRRLYVQEPPETFLEHMRADLAEHFEEGIEGNRIRLKRFVDQNSEDAVLSDPRLQVAAGSLLSIRLKLESALVHVRAGDPLIFALEASGPPANVRRAGIDPAVKSFEPAIEIGGRISVPRTPKPLRYQQRVLHPRVAAMTASDIYRTIRELAAGARAKKRF